MTIRKKLILSNILMIIIPLFLSAVVGYALLESYGTRYWDSLEDMFNDQNGVYSVQSLIYAYRDEFYYEEWQEYDDSEEAADEEDGAEESSDSQENTGDSGLLNTDGMQGDSAANLDRIRELNKELTDMGYHFRVQINAEQVYSGLSAAEKAMLFEYFEGSYDEVGDFTITDEEGSIIKSTFEADGDTVEIAAVCQVGSGAQMAGDSYLRKHVVTFVLLFGVFVLLAVILTNILLSRWISHIIMRPLKKLQSGTREIAEGNLESSIDYEKKDEFGEVCHDFDDMRARLKESVETRLQYDQYRRELIVGISHDLRTPLTSIKGYVEGLQDGIANTPEKQARYYKAIHIRAMDMEALVESLSTFAKLENKEYKYHLEPVNMSEYLQQLLKEYREEANRKRTEIIFDNYADQMEVLLDVQEMHRVFINLFENSIKYRIKNETVIHIETRNIGEKLQILVSDDGPGVPEKELENIFNSFYRVDEARSKPESGSGLGLAIVKRIVEGHKGTIEAYCEKGLTMKIVLPLKQKEKGDVAK